MVFHPFMYFAVSTTDPDSTEATKPTDETASIGMLDRLLASRWLIPGLATATLFALGFFFWAVLGTLDSMCYEDLKAARLETTIALRLDHAGSFAKELKKGPDDGVKWSVALKNELRKATKRASEGRRALKQHKGRSALAAVVDVEKALATAKQLATERVNYILQVQNRDKPDEFEKLRLEGKSLVNAVRDISSALNSLDAGNLQRPGMCGW